MKASKKTKRALIPSVLAVIMCVAMLIGTTFAWFTDTASTSVNKIQAGTLDVVLEQAIAWDDDGNPTAWESAEGKTLQFRKAAGATEGEAVLWEPGCTYELPELRISNNGNLALKYKIEITGITGDTGLNKVIDWTKTVTASDGTKRTEELTADHSLAAKAVNYLTISGTMDTAAGNEYQGKSISGISITVLAAQDTVEYDSEDNQYDKDAEYPEVSAANLADELSKLEDNAEITVTGVVESALTISKPVTIHNLTATAPVTVSTDGVTLDAANISSDTATKPALVVSPNVKNVTITNSVITAATGSGNNHTAVNIPASGKVVFTGNTISNDYNGVEFGQGSTQALGDGSVISNNTFKNIGNNAISIYRVAEDATVTIENNVFENVSNAIRLSNYVTSTSAKFEIKNNTVDIANSWQDVFVLLQDVGNNDFSKYTLNFSGNSFNETPVYYKVWQDSADADENGNKWVTTNQPTTTGILTN